MKRMSIASLLMKIALPFFEEDGEYTAEYEYDGFEILTYEAGNRGVRFVFEKYDGDEEMPQFIQFSDHEISPTDSHHFHLYWGMTVRNY